MKRKEINKSHDPQVSAGNVEGTPYIPSTLNISDDLHALNPLLHKQTKLTVSIDDDDFILPPLSPILVSKAFLPNSPVHISPSKSKPLKK